MAYFHKFSVRHLEVLSRFFMAILFWLDKVVYKLLISAQASFRVQRSFTPQVLSEVFVDELNKSDEKLSEIVKGIENRLIAQDDQLSQILKHLKEIDITPSTADGSKKDWKSSVSGK